MALGQVVGTLTRESSFSEKVRAAITAAKVGDTLAISWAIEPATSAKLMPLKAKADVYSDLLQAHAEKSLYNGQKINLTEKEQTDLFNARKLVDQQRIEIVRKAMNAERNKHQTAASNFAETLHNVIVKVGTETNVDPADCRFTFSVYRKLTDVDSADAIAEKYAAQPATPATPVMEPTKK